MRLEKNKIIIFVQTITIIIFLFPYFRHVFNFVNQQPVITALYKDQFYGLSTNQKSTFVFGPPAQVIKPSTDWFRERSICPHKSPLNKIDKMLYDDKLFSIVNIWLI